MNDDDMLAQGLVHDAIGRLILQLVNEVDRLIDEETPLDKHTAEMIETLCRAISHITH